MSLEQKVYLSEKEHAQHTRDYIVGSIDQSYGKYIAVSY